MSKFPKHYIFVFPVRFVFRLPARSLTSRSLAEGRRFGEGRDFVFRISVFYPYLILGSTIA